MKGMPQGRYTKEFREDALKRVNMRVAPGEVVGLVGPSDSGKSTLLKSLGAVIEPTEAV